MAIADVKMQTGWIPVCIKRLIMNKYNQLYMFYLAELQSYLIILLLHTLVSGSNKYRYEVIFTRSILPTNQGKASTALENLKGERQLMFFFYVTSSIEELHLS